MPPLICTNKMTNNTALFFIRHYDITKSQRGRVPCTANNLSSLITPNIYKYSFAALLLIIYSSPCAVLIDAAAIFDEQLISQPFTLPFLIIDDEGVQTPPPRPSSFKSRHADSRPDAQEFLRAILTFSQLLLRFMFTTFWAISRAGSLSFSPRFRDITPFLLEGMFTSRDAAVTCLPTRLVPALN